MPTNDYIDTTGASGSNYIILSTTTCCGTCSGGGWYYFQKTYAVKLPVRWKQKGKDAFIKLVNDETQTGWKVTMVIHGKIEILDPNVEIVTAKKFAATMRWTASQADKEKIDAFTGDQIS